MRKINDNSVIIKHSAIVQISNEFTRVQRGAFNIMLYNAYEDLAKDKIHKIKVSDLRECLAIQPNDKNFDANKYIKKVVHKLTTRSVSIDILGKSRKYIAQSKMSKVGYSIEEGSEISLPLFKAIHTKKRGIIEYEFNEYLADFLYNPDVYAKIKLSMQQKFLSKYATALYEICVDYIGINQTPEIELKKLKILLLGNEKKKSYDKFFLLNSKVLKPAIKNINEDTDINIEAQLIRKGRFVSAVKFIIRKKTQEELYLIEAPKLQIEEKTKEELIIKNTDTRDSKGIKSIKDILLMKHEKAMNNHVSNQNPISDNSNKYRENKHKFDDCLKQILSFTNHKKSIGFYRKSSWAFVLAGKDHLINNAVSIIKADYTHEKGNKAKLLNAKIQELAEKNNINISAKSTKDTKIKKTI